jgi:hypothetical protein
MAALSNPTNECGAIYLVKWYVDTGGFCPNQLAAYVIDTNGTMDKNAVITQAINSIHACITQPNDDVEGEEKKSKREYDFCDVRGPFAPFRVEGGMLWTRESVASYLKSHEPRVFKKVKHMVVVASALDG